MKLQRISITNFQGVADIDVTPTNPVILFCGPNAAGKSSIVEAIKLASIGEGTRVSKKKDYKQLLHNGSKSGSIIIDTDVGRMSVALPGGKHSVPGPITDALQFVMDAPRFGRMTPKERHDFLFNLTGVKVTLEEMRKRMTERGILKEVIESALPLLRGGFDVAAAHGAERISELRGSWQTVTGEKWGELKGETWQADGNPHKADTNRLEEINLGLEACEQALEHTNKELGRAQAFLAQQDRLRSLAEAGKPDPSAIEQEITAATEAAAKQDEKVKILREALEDARLEAQPCPHCGEILKVTKRAKIIKADPDSAPDGLEALERKVTEADGVLNALNNAIAGARHRLQNALSEHRAIKAAKEVLKETYTEEQRDEYDERLRTLAGERAAMMAEKNKINDEIRAAKDHAGKTTKAREIHRMILAWASFVEAVGDTGIPAELLSLALGPINERLIESAKQAEWPEVRIDASMEIMMRGRPYHLLSESEKWRADASISEAVACLSKTNLVVLDRLDVLRPQDRGAVLDWAQWLAGQGYQVLMTATLKQKPSLEGFDVYWIEGGRVAA